MWELKPEYRHYKEQPPAPTSTDNWQRLHIPTFALNMYDVEL
jgi:hypothetical protein